MAEEKPKGPSPEPENTPVVDSPPSETPPKEETKTETEESKVDYEKRYKDLQADHTKVSQRAADAEARIEQLEQPPEEEDVELEEDGFVDRKTAAKMIKDAVSQAVSQVGIQAANTYFRKNYSDYVQYENAIAGIMQNPKKPPKKGASREERIDAAVKEFNDLTKEAKDTATAEAEAKVKADEEAKRKASGLGASSTTPSKSDDEGKSDEQELADRKARQAKQRGLA